MRHEKTQIKKRPTGKPGVQHAATVGRQGNGLGHTNDGAVPGPDTPMSRTEGPAAPGEEPRLGTDMFYGSLETGDEPRLRSLDCHLIACARQSARKFLDREFETADLIATYRSLVKCGLLYGDIDRPEVWTPRELAIVIAADDDRRGSDHWTPAELESIRAEAREILRAEHADARNSSLPEATPPSLNSECRPEPEAESELLRHGIEVHPNGLEYRLRR